MFSHPGVEGQPVVGVDGAVSSWTDGGLAAIDSFGTTRWTYRAWPYEGGPPVLSPSGVVYAQGLTASEITVPNAAILGVSRDGRLVAKLRPSGFSKGAPAAETAAGTLYVPYVGPTEAHAGLVSVPAGKRPRLLQPGFTFQDFAVAPSGDIYAIGRYSSNEGRLSLERLTPAGKVRWRHSIDYDGSSLMVGLHGRVYVASGLAVGSASTPSTEVSAYTAHGRLIWSRHPSMGLAVLGQRADGAIVAAGQRALTVYGTNGTRLWRMPLGQSSLDAVPSLALDAQGTAVVGSGDGRVRTFSAAGGLLNTLDGGPASTTGSPEIALGADGRLIVVGTDGVLRAYR